MFIGAPICAVALTVNVFSSSLFGYFNKPGMTELSLTGLNCYGITVQTSERVGVAVYLFKLNYHILHFIIEKKMTGGIFTFWAFSTVVAIQVNKHEQ